MSQGDSFAEEAEPRAVALTPELFSRIQRMAKALNKTPFQIVNDAVQVAWVRYATAAQLKPEKW